MSAHTIDVRHSICPETRDFLAALVHEVVRALHHVEQRMASVDENLSAINTKVDTLGGVASTLGTSFAALAADVRAVLAAGPGDTDPTTQAKFDALSTTLDNTTTEVAAALASVQGLNTEVGDRNGDGFPLAGGTVPPPPVTDPNASIL